MILTINTVTVTINLVSMLLGRRGVILLYSYMIQFVTLLVAVLSLWPSWWLSDAWWLVVMTLDPSQHLLSYQYHTGTESTGICCWRLVFASAADLSNKWFSFQRVTYLSSSHLQSHITVSCQWWCVLHSSQIEIYCKRSCSASEWPICDWKCQLVVIKSKPKREAQYPFTTHKQTIREGPVPVSGHFINSPKRFYETERSSWRWSISCFL